MTTGTSRQWQRDVGLDLRRLRGERPMTEVAAAVGWSQAKISRIETGRTRPRLDDIVALLDIYGADDGTRQRLTDAVVDRSPMGPLHPLVPTQQELLVEILAELREIRRLLEETRRG